MKNLFKALLITVLASTSAVAKGAPLSKSQFALEAAGGYAFNKKFDGPAFSLRAKCHLKPMCSGFTHALSLEVMGADLKAKELGPLTKIAVAEDPKKVVKISAGRNINEVKITQVPILLNYHLFYTLDKDDKWKFEASAGGGVQYFSARRTNTHQLLINEEVIPVTDAAINPYYTTYFGTNTGFTKFSENDWKLVGKFAIGLHYDTVKWNAFVRGFTLLSESKTWTTPLPNAPKPTSVVKIASAPLKWNAWEFGVEAGIGIKF